MRLGLSSLFIPSVIATAAVASAAPAIPTARVAPTPTHTAVRTPTAPTTRPAAPAHTTPATVHVSPTPTVATPPPATIHVSPSAVSASKPVKIPAFKPPPEGADTATIIAAGKALIQRQSNRTKEMLPTSGFNSLDDIGKSVAALGPQRSRAVDLLKAEDKLEFTMRTPGNIRESIATRGFLNQHDTKSSHGTLDPNTRANVEASFLGVSRAEYDKLPNTIRPKYGYLRPAQSSGVHLESDGATQYGEDIFVFKRSAVKDHTTVYPTDSLGFSAVGWPAASPDTVKPSQWHHALVPWKDRMLLAPELSVTDANGLQISAGAPTGFNAVPKKWGNNRYLEIQIWRPLGMEDVERFEFSSSPPTGAFLKALRDNGVKIYQQGNATEWKGDTGPTTLRFRIVPRTPSSPFETSEFAEAA